MERSKLPASKKSSKPKVHAPPGDFIALGKGKSESDISGVRRPLSPQPIDRKIAPGNERKREASSTTGGVNLTKKPKLMSQTFTPLGRHATEPERKASPSTVTPLAFEESAIDVEPCEMLEKVLAAEESGDDEKIEGILCGAVKALHGSRVKPDPVVYLTVMYLAKTHPTLFCSELVIEAFCSLLKRDPTLNFKAKGNALVSVLACNTLMASFAEEDNWPDDFVKVYVEDSLGERVWLDREDCKGFVENIQTAFHTKIPPKSMLLASTDPIKSETPGSASPVLNLFEEEDVSKSPDQGESETEKPVSESGVILPRYPFQQDSIETYIHDIVHDYLNRRQPMDASARNLIRLMSVTAGYAEVRSLASQRLEMWLQNPKLARTAQDLLMSVCMNCNQKEHSDIEVIAQLIKIRMKTKPLVNHYLNCMRELLAQHSDNLRIILTHTIYNELSQARNPNNMSLLATTFQVSGEAAAKMLAEVFQDLSANKDDYLRALRALLREIVRAVRHDMNFPAFCLGLMQERTETKFSDMDATFKERFVMSMTDLITLNVLLGITPAVRESVAALSKGENKDIEVLHHFKNHCAVIQRDAVWWLHMVVPKMMEIKPAEYVHCLHKVLFLEEAQHYYSKDNWPPEGDRITMLRLCAEVPIMEDTLMRVLLIGLSRELPLSAVDAVELADQLIRRAAALYYGVGMEVLHVERLQLIDALLNLCAYRHPEKIALPKGYQPPTLAISTLYWKAWIMLLILSAFNPSTFGLAAWEKYPTLKLMMEMAMTNNFTFPPPTLASDDKTVEELKNRERQIHQREVQGILEFESHLAAATSKVTITESNSLLIDQVTSMDPSGVARCPPPKILEQLQSLNNTLKIGQMLCRSRNPDFLLDIIQRQGTSQSMPWLAEMVESSEGSLDVLPVQCLCEFLLHEPPELSETTTDAETFKTEKYRRRQKLKKQRQLLGRLQTVVHGERSDSNTTFEVLDYFLKRLSSTQAVSRSQAIKGLSMVLSKSQTSRDSESDDKMEVDTDSGKTTHAWLLENLPALPLFEDVKDQACLALRQACQIETDPSLVSAYVVFLSQHAMDQNLHKLDDLALDLAQLIVERTSVVNHILPADSDVGSARDLKNKTLTALIDLHMNYLVKAKEPDKEAYSWSNTQDQIILQWESSESATMHILVVHAMIILLTYGPPSGESLYQDLLETWFPETGHLPSAFLLDTSEEALLLPDWLKLRMIRSSVDRLVNAALQELEPSQLLVFVQSFGIPVSSMSKLLLCLDNAVAIDSARLEQDVVDKTYMAQLIEIQHKRGAQGGENFNKMLNCASSPVKQDKPDSEAMLTESSVPSCWQVKKEEDSTLFGSPNQLVQSLLQIFMTPGISSPSLNKSFQSLIKAVSGDRSRAEEVLSAFQQIFNSPQSAEFCGKMFDMPSKSCPLLKLFIAKQSSLHQHLKPMMDQLESLSKGRNSALSSLVYQFLTSYGQEKHSSNESEKAVPEGMFQTKGKLDCDKFIQAIQTVDESNLECLVQQCIEKSIEMKDTAASVGIACKVLLDSEQSLPESAACLFVDWLELLDPEIIQSNAELQQQLLFAKKASLKSVTKSMTRKRNQPYLLALLTHQSNWTTLHRCVDCLLHPKQGSRYDPTSVLDFLWACLHIPKIWQGRERKLQTYTSEDLLGLTGEHITAVVKFITEEALSVVHVEPAGGQTTVGNVTRAVQSRLDLLLLCLADKDEKLKTVVTFLLQENLHKSPKESVYNSLFLELYLHRPYIMSWLPSNSPFLTELHSAHLSQSQMDTITHRIISALGEAKSGKVAEKRMIDANITCRKLAAEHPSLLLRQLPMIAAVLQGKTQFTMGEMVHRNFVRLFNYCLGLLELLQPHVFRREHSALPDVLESYFSLIRAHGRDNRQLNQLIVKFVIFLNNFLSCDPQRAITMLQKYTEILSNVSLLFPDLSELKSLLAGLTLPVQNQNEAAMTDDVNSSLGLAIKPVSVWSAAQLEPYHKKLKKNTPTEIIQVLTDLDETSKRKVEILEHFEDDLKRFMTNGSDIVRNTTFSLFMRHLKHNPRRAGDFVPVFLQCLSQTSPDIINTALTNLAEFTVLCQAHAQVILQKVFTLGITSSIETSSYISDTLHLLNLESALT